MLSWLLTRGHLYTIATIALTVAIIMLYEVRSGRSLRRYLTRGTLTDALYNAFYASGIYTLFLWGPIFAFLQVAVRRYAPFLELKVLDSLPAPVHYGVFIICTDFIAYWQHRWMHANRFLWTLHGIHHSQTNLTFLTARRFHFVDSIFDNLVWFGPAIILGIPARVSIPVALVQQVYSTLQHSDIDLGWGRAEWVFISPRYHSVHHSVDARDHDKNFGALLAIWDHLFGTAVHVETNRRVYGIRDMQVPEGFFRQIVFPFRQMAVQLGWTRPAVPIPESAPDAVR